MVLLTILCVTNDKMMLLIEILEETNHNQWQDKLMKHFSPTDYTREST